ncbi:MAG: NAD-dependent malic enzyme [Candidatus Peribacteraceae bacterium]|nr:NAD-dependent malic enzyme [Candidatus Peribacteraceae bacterium]
MSDQAYKSSLAYHEQSPAGKISLMPTKPLRNSADLSLAYTPGVAGAVLNIAKNPDDAYKYTSKGNLIAVISNGTAVLGLGNRGALASKPVMEGKAVLFKRFAGIDAIDIEINSTDPAEIIRTIELISPTFGGINLEDIKAPECMEIERALIGRLDIPVFHDDQHGTAVVVSAGLHNAANVAGKDLRNLRIVLNGAGSAGLAIANMLLAMGCDKEQLLLCDSKGVIYEGRNDLNSFKTPFARKTDLRTLADALRGADVFIGISVAGALTGSMLASMAKDPIVFAMANPMPEMLPSDAWKTRDDVIMATGRSDFPNQVNNLLCFPFLFRGALDTRAKSINQAMKVAASEALAALAREPVPQDVLAAYGIDDASFGRDYLLPKPFDHRLLPTIAPAVAKAAMESGVARVKVDLKEYEKKMERSAEELAKG